MTTKHRSLWFAAAFAGVLGLGGTAAATPPKCKVICCELTCEFDATCTWGGIATKCSEFPQWCDRECTFADLDDDGDLEMAAISSEAIEPVSLPDAAALGAEVVDGWIASLR